MGSIETAAEEEILSKIKSFIKEKADRTITLAQVRPELSSIKGNLSETISKQREERG